MKANSSQLKISFTLILFVILGLGSLAAQQDFRISFGSFSLESNAKNLSDSLSRVDIDSEVRKILVGDVVLFRVFSKESYSTSQVAKQGLKNLEVQKIAPFIDFTKAWVLEMNTHFPDVSVIKASVPVVYVETLSSGKELVSFEETQTQNETNESTSSTALEESEPPTPLQAETPEPIGKKALEIDIITAFYAKSFEANSPLIEAWVKDQTTERGVAFVVNQLEQEVLRKPGDAPILNALFYAYQAMEGALQRISDIPLPLETGAETPTTD